MDLRGPDSSAPRVVAVLGPTNTGKTHLAVERMLGHASGMIGLPLRLLAREIYDRVARTRGPSAVALITGEEKIVPPRAHYFVCTVEAMPLEREVEFLAVDEVQLAADPERGHLFTHRLLNARGRYETMLLGAATMAPLVRTLLPRARIETRERFSALSWSGHQKITRLPRRSAVVAFSAQDVYAIAELLRRQRGGAAVVMGSLSPRTRNAQVALYQSGEVDFLVATDAIGMGLNMDVDHVAFAGLAKFDGRRTRPLTPAEIGQIAGRAGRFRTDGSFGVTGAAPPLEGEVVQAIEAHAFERVRFAEWRNAELDFTSVPDLLASLRAGAPQAGLRPAREALDETVLRHLVGEAALLGRVSGRRALGRLWQVCQTPDFRKTTLEDHVRLAGALFGFLAGDEGHVPEAWMAGQISRLDRLDGEIDTLSGRLAGVRTLAYVAHRPGWLAAPERWRDATRHLEERLSDTLHEQLMARFVDRRTSALVRGLGKGAELLAGVAGDGTVTVEGHFVGKLRGLAFEAARGAGALEQRALRGAAERAVAPEVNRRLGRLAADVEAAFALDPEGEVLWRGEAVATLTSDQPLRPAVRLHGEMGDPASRERARQRLEAFLAAEAARRLPRLKALSEAVSSGALKGLARGLAWRLVEAGGVLDRRGAEADVRALSRAERRALRSLGVRIGALSLYIPDQARAPARAFATAFARRAAPHWRPSSRACAPLPSPPPPPRALGLRGLVAAGARAARVEDVERLHVLVRGEGDHGQGGLPPEALAALGWSAEEAAEVLRGLGFAPFRPKGAEGPARWVRRPLAEAAQAPASPTPFAVLAELNARALARRAPRRRRRAARV